MQTSGAAVLITLIAIPLLVFVYAIYPRFGVKPTSNDFLFGGLTFGRTIASTVGTLFTVSFFFSAVLGYATLASSWPLVGLYFVTPIICILIAIIVSSKEVTQYYGGILKSTYASDATSVSKSTEAFLGYLSSNYGRHCGLAIWTILKINVLLILTAETAYILLWMDTFLSSSVSHPWIVALFLIWLCFLYVYLGGYEFVLRTDKIQICIIFFALCLILWDVTHHIGWFTSSKNSQSITQFIWNSVSTDIPKISLEQANILDSSKGIDFSNQARSYSLIGAMLFTFFVFLGSSDVWIRITRAAYLTPIKGSSKLAEGIFGNRFQLRKSKKLWLFSAAVTCLILILFQLPGSLGVYGSTLVSNQLIPEASANSPIDIIQWASKQSFTKGDLSILPSMNALILIVGLLLLTMATLTTLDTSLMSVAQLKADYHYGTAKSILSTNEIRTTISSYFTSVALTVLIVKMLSGDNFSSIVQAFGLIGGVFFVCTTFIIGTRTFTPWWMKGRDFSVALAYGIGTIGSVFLAIYLDIKNPDIFAMRFVENSRGWDIGRILILSIFYYFCIFIVFSFLDRNGIAKTVDDKIGKYVTKST
ncbi:MAG: hypothetical protein AAF434_08415 [Pseudomonadota bacterium]